MYLLLFVGKQNQNLLILTICQKGQYFSAFTQHFVNNPGDQTGT